MATRKKERADRFADLTWDDLEQWAGGKIVSRGERYQKQGSVSDLAVTGDGGLVAWVSGTRRYATKVIIDEDGGPDSVCTCPYGFNCKHGVAVVLEYLEQIGQDRRIPTASQDDDRLVLLEGAGEDETLEGEEAGLPEPARMEIEPFLQGKSKGQLVELLLALARQHPDIAQDLMDRQQPTSGRTKQLMARLRREIREIAGQPAWEDDWYGRGGSMADYSEIRHKLEALLDAGHADEVLSLGRELMIAGTRAVEDSGDEGETAEEVAACMPVVAKALDRSSLAPAARLAWAVEAVLKDQYDLSSAFEDYLDQRHPK
jgi:uncharacterized Zn finger protein